MRRSWLPSEPLRLLVLVHGFGEHSGRYEAMASWLAARGCAVHAYDQQGHGQSSGKRGHVDAFDDFLDDLALFIARCQAEHSNLSTVLLGHSFGGLVAAAHASLRNPPIDLLITSGAALAISPDLSPLKIAAARLLRRVVPRLSMNAGLDAAGISRDPEVVRLYREDPLVHGQATAAFGAAMVEGIERTAEAAQRIRVPTLVLHGGADPLCLPEGSARFFESLPHTRVAGSAIRTYPQLMHEIFNEPEREMVYQDLLDWILEREAEHAPSPQSAPSAMEARPCR